MPTQETLTPLSGWRRKLYIIIFEADTRSGRLFDLALIATILLSLLTVVLESVASIRQSWGTTTQDTRLAVHHSVHHRVWITADLHSQAATLCAQLFRHGGFALHPALYLGLFIPESRFLADIRVLRLLRMFRILKLTRYMGEARELKRAMLASRRKILVFLVTVIVLVIILGTLMYVIEGEANGFTSIPIGIYWAIVTLTTVGFGDITPKTPLGRHWPAWS
jgi:voltage-gated potassium channel